MALKVESTTAYQRTSIRINDTRTHETESDDRKGRKKARREADSYEGSNLTPTTSRFWKDNAKIKTRPLQDLSRVKCYNCGQLGHMFLAYTQPRIDSGILLLGKV